MTDLAKRVEELATGYVPAAVIFAAAELGLFDALAEPATFGELAARISATENGTARLCRALAAIGLVAIDDTRVRLLPGVREAFANEDVACALALHRRILMPPMLRLADAVRAGGPQHRAWAFARPPVRENPYDELARHPDEMRTLVIAMDRGSAGVGTAIARTVDLSQVRLLVDLGCGGGVVDRELLAAYPELRIASFDHEPTCFVARERSRAAGLTDRHAIQAADIRAGVPVSNADAVLVSAVLADFPIAERAQILGVARATLRPGGLLLVSETLLDDDRCGPASATILSLVMLAAARGDQLSGAELTAELISAGFAGLAIHRGMPRDLVVATREP